MSNISIIAWYQEIGMKLPRKRMGIGIDHCMHCTFLCCVLHDCDCVIVCYKLREKYVHGLMYIGKVEH